MVEKQNGPLCAPPGRADLHFSSSFLSSVNQLVVAAEAALRGGEGSIFELRPNPIPGVSETVFNPGWAEARLPEPAGGMEAVHLAGTASPEATVQVVSNGGVAPQILKFRDGWACSGCWRSARRRRRPSAPNSTGKFSVPRNFKGAPLKEAGDLTEYPYPFRLNFRSVSGSDPRLLLKLRRLQLPDRITQ